MELKTFFAQDLMGNVIPSPTVTVYLPGTTTKATGLQNASGAALTNPFSGTGNGQVVLAAPDGDYDLKIEGAGRTTTMRVRFIDAPASVDSVNLADYAALRAYGGSIGRAYITGALATKKPAGIAGVFQHDPTDTTSADNGGTIIVGSDGRRWKRDYSGGIQPKWFGAAGGGVTDDTTSVQLAVSAAPQNSAVDLGADTYAVRGVQVSTNNVIVKNGRLVAHPGITANHVIKAAPGTSGVQFIDLRVYINKAAIAATDCSGIFFDQCTKARAVNCHVDGSRNDNYTTTFPSAIYGYMASKIDVIDCTVINADKEGIMFRMCDDVYINNCEGRDSGYSNIGTSGGSRAIINACRAFNSGATNITMNSQDSIVSNCLAVGNALYNGILIGHDHETEQYANNCLVANNRVVNSADKGVAVTYGVNITVEGNVITNSTNDGIYITPRPDVMGGTVIANNAISGGARGIVCSSATTGSFVISGNSIRSCTGSGIQTANNGEISILGNTFRDVGSSAIYAYSHISGSTLTGNGIQNLRVDNNTFRGIYYNAISCFGVRQVSVCGNTFEYVNTAGSAYAHILKVSASNGGAVNTYMPTSVVFACNTTKNTSANSLVVEIASNLMGDGVTTRASIHGNDLQDFAAGRLFGGMGTAVGFTSNNQIGTDNRYTFQTITAGTTTTTINNSNITVYGSLPSFIPRNDANWSSANVRITSIGNGTVTLQHSAPAANASANMVVL